MQASSYSVSSNTPFFEGKPISDPASPSVVSGFSGVDQGGELGKNAKRGALGPR